MQQGIKKLQWFEYLKVVFLEILNLLLCRVFAKQVTYSKYYFVVYPMLNTYVFATYIAIMHFTT